MQVIRAHKCGFCEKEYLANGSKVIGITGIKGFICVSCIKRAKQTLVNALERDKNEEPNKGA